MLGALTAGFLNLTAPLDLEAPKASESVAVRVLLPADAEDCERRENTARDLEEFRGGGVGLLVLIIVVVAVVVLVAIIIPW